MFSKQGGCRIIEFKEKIGGDVGPGPMGQKFQIIIVESWMHFEA